MKITLLLFVMLIITSAMLAQAPQAINYQAVARDATGNIIANQAISFRLSILQGGPAGTVVYSESHSETSNQFGLVTMEIGRGTVILGVFADISWGTDSYYLKTEMDPTGGTSYQEMGTSQFLSVPYAFYSDTTRYAYGGGQACGMDVCYDNHAPGTGAGRFIFADQGAVDIQVPLGCVANCGLHSTIFDCLNPFHAITALTFGTGNSVNAVINNIANASDAVFGQTNGTRFGVYGRNGAAIPAPDGAAVIAGVGGESIALPGVAGYSRDSDGVHGGTRKTGTYGDDANPTTIDGGVHGVPALLAENPDGDNFGVVGTQSGYTSTGVLGIGGMEGHGVIGIPGGSTGATTAGIRGFTRESSSGWPPDYFPLMPVENKEQIGVFGQAWNFTGIWGESRYRYGVVGTTGSFLNLVNLDNGCPAPQSVGVYGYATEIGRIGVLGRSFGGNAGQFMADGPGHGVFGSANGAGDAAHFITTGSGNAVYGEIANAANQIAAVAGTTNGSGDAGFFSNTGTGNGIYAKAVDGAESAGYFESANGYAVKGIATGNGIAGSFKADGVGNAVFAQTTNEAAAYTSVFLAQGNTIPVYAEAEDGYGGKFIGGGSGAFGGIYGLSSGADGVVGKSTAIPGTNAGVRAVGNGASAPGIPQAAALQIENGAITVTGASRPAGKIILNGDWGNLLTDDALQGTEYQHAHLIGYSQVKTVDNDLITPDSYIQLTVFNAFSHAFAQILFINQGNMEIKVTTMGTDPPPEEMIVHYLIINPED